MSEASEAEPIKVGLLMDYFSGGTPDWTSFSEPMARNTDRASPATTRAGSASER